MSKDLLTLKEVADRYGVKEHQVRYAIKVGKIKAFKKGWIILIKRKTLPKVWPIQRGV